MLFKRRFAKVKMSGSVTANKNIPIFKRRAMKFSKASFPVHKWILLLTNLQNVLRSIIHRGVHSSYIYQKSGTSLTSGTEPDTRYLSYAKVNQIYSYCHPHHHPYSFDPTTRMSSASELITVKISVLLNIRSYTTRR